MTRGEATQHPRSARPGRARTRGASAVVVLAATGALLAGCTGGQAEPTPTDTGEPVQSPSAAPSPTSESPDPSSSPETEQPEIPEITEDDLLETYDWQEFDNGFVEFEYPPEWDVVTSAGPAASWLMDVVDEEGGVVAQFTPEPFEGDADGPILVSAVDELGRIAVDTDADADQILLTVATEPSEDATENVRKFQVGILDPEQAEAWLTELRSPLGFMQTDDDWAYFVSTAEFLQLDGETVEDPDDAQIAEFMGTERYLQLLTLMESVD
ncbi:hypothetical protein [Zhihengliuella halotolerans]|uniref:Uncharacterized protein n=1 Tax=Zhihengliuella halotolerans TaxID=370736 RepID=A0A4Q8AGR1_9MICC|nr:hypothetical protein [Zhihengliuella halotolerans]RZU62945.1 hypothetical protein EV380_2550 [Zhihengliuella halotolerans]